MLKRAWCFGALLGALIGSLATTPTATAINGAPRVQAPPWTALVTADNVNGFNYTCSGIVVGDGYILTAAHCLRAGDQADSPLIPQSKFRVWLGVSDWNQRQQGAAYAVDGKWEMPGYVYLRQNDAALLHLAGFDAGRWHAVPIAAESGPVLENGGLTIFGYGNSVFTFAGFGGEHGARVLRKSPDGAFVRNGAGSSLSVLSVSAVGGAHTMHGDSGAAWLRWTAGAWQIVAVNDLGSIEQDSWSRHQYSTVASGTSSFAKTTGGETLYAWVRRLAGLPLPAVGQIVRGSDTGAAWLVDAAGYRQWITTGKIYNCLVSQGHTVYANGNTLQIEVDSIPDRVGRHASCTPSPTPPPSRDSQPPTNPGGVASFGTSATSAGLRWQPSTDNVGVAGYALYLNGHRVANVPAGTTTYFFTGLTPCSDYTLGVAAVDAAENYSQTEAVTTSTFGCPGQDMTPPTDPSGVHSFGETSISIGLAWQASTDNVGVAGYALYLNGQRVANVPTNVTMYTFTGLSPCSNYTVGVAAVDAMENYSNIVSISATTSPGCPGQDTTPPTDPTGVYSFGETGTSISIAWQPSTDNVAVTGYALYLNGQRVANVPYNAPTSYVFTGLTPCANFVIGVQAVDAANNYSNTVVIAATTSPGC